MAMNLILLVLYAVASIAYAVQFARRTFTTSRVATVLLVLGLGTFLTLARRRRRS